MKSITRLFLFGSVVSIVCCKPRLEDSFQNLGNINGTRIGKNVNELSIGSRTGEPLPPDPVESPMDVQPPAPEIVSNETTNPTESNDSSSNPVMDPSQCLVSGMYSDLA